MSIRIILLALAAILFALAALGVEARTVNLTAAGLFVLTLAFLIA